MAPNQIKKLYYSISEVSDLTGVEPHVLRFWEKEFPMLRPRRGRSGNRTYKDRDIQIIQRIRDLVWKQKYTIQGACERLRDELAQPNAFSESQVELSFAQLEREAIEDLRKMLLDIRGLLENDPPQTSQ